MSTVSNREPVTAPSIGSSHWPTVALLIGVKLPPLRSLSRMPSTDGGKAVIASPLTIAPGVPLTIIESPYRSLSRPLLKYLAELKRAERADVVTVVLPEYVPDTWWEHVLHGQSAQFLKLALLFRPGFVVVSVPYHAEPRPAAPAEVASRGA